MKFSVVICAYTEERWNELVESVRAVQAQSLKPHQIIVAVDHNAALYRRAREVMTGVDIVQSAEPQGLSGVRNSGIASATGDVIAFVDDDALAQPDWLENLARLYADDQVAGVGGAIEPLWQSGKPSWFPAEFNWVVGCTYRGMPEAAAQVRNLIGCNMSFRADILKSVNGFSHKIGRTGGTNTGNEDDETEICIRIGQQFPYKKLIFEPAARVLHKVPQQRTTWDYFMRRCSSEGRSKALLSQMVGAGRGLATERRYALYALPTGMMIGLGDALRGDAAGLARTSTIALGLASTVVAYVWMRLALLFRRTATSQVDAGTPA